MIEVVDDATFVIARMFGAMKESRSGRSTNVQSCELSAL